MDTPKPQNGHEVPNAPGMNSADKPKRMNGRRGKGKAEGTEQFEIGFVVTTPAKFRVDLLKAKDHQAQVRALFNPSNPLKRTADFANGDSSEQPEKRVKKNVGGRPRIHPPKPKSTVRFFKKRTRIQQTLYPDIWGRIFDFSTPEFLLQARQTSRMLRLLLQKESQWRTARYSTYGFDHPDPPPGLDEMQYADLLTGSGCQTKGCKEKSVRKVYWGFQRRWCPTCLRTNTIKESDTTDLFAAYVWLRDSVPRATFDTWNRYCWVGEHPHRPSWAHHWGSHTRYSRLAISNLIRDFDKFMTVSPNEEERTREEREAWVEEKAENNRLLMESIEAMEAYVEQERRRKALEVQAIKARRIEFFKERAAKMDPPLSIEALNLLPKYLLAIDIQKLPSERSWRELRPKLEADRAKAEERLRLEAEEKKTHLPRQGLQASSEYSEKVLRRKEFKTPEQIFILDLAEKVIAELGEMVASGTLAHVDFIPFVFRRVYDAYQQIPDECKPVDDDGRPYRLLMDDARMIHKERILHFISRWDSSKCKAAVQLKCPGCKRKEGCRRHSFEDLIYHILTHTTRVGTLSYFRPQPHTPSSIAWCNLEWPKNLPILATHRTVSGEWDPNDGSDPIQAPNVLPNVVRNAFEGRCVVIGNDPPRCDFVKNLVHAASLLQGTTLAGKFMTQIAFKYAVDRHIGTGSEAFVPIKVLHDLPVALLRANVRGLFERFRCHKCVDMDGRDRCGKRFATNAHSLGELTAHYLEAHEHSSWTLNLFHFPPAEDLWDELVKPGMEQAYKIFDSLFPEDGDSPAIIPWGAPTTSDKAKLSLTTPIPAGSNLMQLGAVDPNVMNFEMQGMDVGVAESTAQNSKTLNWNTQELNFDDLIDPELIAQTVIAQAFIAQAANSQVASAQALNAQVSNAEAAKAQASSTDQWNAQLPNVQWSDSQKMNARLSSELASEPQQWSTQGSNARDLNVPESYIQEPIAQASIVRELSAPISDDEALGVEALSALRSGAQALDAQVLGAQALDAQALDAQALDAQALSDQELGAQVWNWPKLQGPKAEQLSSQSPSTKQWNWRELELAEQEPDVRGSKAHEPSTHKSSAEISIAQELSAQEPDALGSTVNGLNAEDSEVGNLEPNLEPEDLEMIDVQMNYGDDRKDINPESVSGSEEVPSEDKCLEDKCLEDKCPEDKCLEDKCLEDKCPEDKCLEDKCLEDKCLEDKCLEDKRLEDKCLEDKCLEDNRLEDNCLEDTNQIDAEPQENVPEPESTQPKPAFNEGGVPEPRESRWKCVGWNPNSLWGNPPDMIY